jgi:hypothetical protein
MTEDEYEEMEDRRRMQQQILRDNLAQADSRSSPDPTMTVKMTTNTGFALGTFDMSESLAIVEDLLDYFGEDEIAALDLDGEGKARLLCYQLLYSGTFYSDVWMWFTETC